MLNAFSFNIIRRYYNTTRICNGNLCLNSFLLLCEMVFAETIVNDTGENYVQEKHLHNLLFSKKKYDTYICGEKLRKKDINAEIRASKHSPLPTIFRFKIISLFCKRSDCVLSYFHCVRFNSFTSFRSTFCRFYGYLVSFGCGHDIPDHNQKLCVLLAFFLWQQSRRLHLCRKANKVNFICIYRNEIARFKEMIIFSSSFYNIVIFR